jgi:hypothetical protein
MNITARIQRHTLSYTIHQCGHSGKVWTHYLSAEKSHTLFIKLLYCFWWTYFDLAILQATMLKCTDTSITNCKGGEFSIYHETHHVILFCTPIMRAIQWKFGNIYLHVDINFVAYGVECAVINEASGTCYLVCLYHKCHNKSYTIPTSSIQYPLQSSLPLISTDCYHVHIVWHKFLLHSNPPEVLHFQHQSLLMFSGKKSNVTYINTRPNYP